MESTKNKEPAHRSRQGFGSVRTRLAFWFMLVSILPLLLLSIVVYRYNVTAIYNEANEKLLSIRDLKVNKLTNWLDERAGDLRVATGDFEIRALESLEQENLTNTDRKRLVYGAEQLLKRVRDNFGVYSRLTIVEGQSGRVLITTDAEMLGRFFHADERIKGALLSAGPYIQDIHLAKGKDVPAMSLSVPISCLDHDGEHRFAVLVAEVDLQESLYPLLLDRTGMGKTGETLIVNRDAYALSELRWEAKAPLRMKIQAEPARLAAQGNRGVIETEDYRGERVLAAYAHIATTGWGFVAKQDLAELHAPIGRLLRLILLALLAMLALTGLTAWGVSKAIARPTLAMAAATERFRMGDHVTRCVIDSRDEFAVLGQAINEMADSLGAQGQILKGVAELSDLAATSANMPDFSRQVLEKICALTQSKLGVFYLCQAGQKDFIPVAAMGTKTELIVPFDAEKLEGQIGLSLLSRDTVQIGSPDPNTPFVFKTFVGEIVPRQILTIPLLVGEEVSGVIALASLHGYDNTVLDLVEQSRPTLGTALANLLAGERTQHLAEELQLQAEELQESNVELALQKGQLKQADRLKSEFLANMSHELRTPLNSVMALSQLMLSRGPGKKPELDREHLTLIERSGHELLNLINDILDLSRIEAGRVDLRLDWLSPQTVAELALEVMRPLSQEKNLRLHIAVDEVATLFSDQDRIKQILLNLLGNAVKFTKEGEVRLLVQGDETQVIFTVSDTGVGIATEDLAFIFDEFRQADGSSTRKYGGTGLGLAISKKLAGLLGGSLTVTSEQGVGSTFSLILPRHAYSPPSAPKKIAVAEPVILVVEDNEVAALQIRHAMEEGGYRVIEARGGAEALERVRQTVPDGIVLDLMMPEVDGFAVLEKIRSMAWTHELPVLVLTAKELTQQDRDRLSHNHVQELILKGAADQNELIAAVDRMLGNPQRGKK